MADKVIMVDEETKEALDAIADDGGVSVGEAVDGLLAGRGRRVEVDEETRDALQAIADADGDGDINAAAGRIVAASSGVS